jgi:hypothetical protein
MDVVVGNEKSRQTRVWAPGTRQWVAADFPVQIVTVADTGRRREAGVRFGVLQRNGRASFLVFNDTAFGICHFDGRKWLNAFEGRKVPVPVITSDGGRDRGVRLRDLDGDGVCELIVANEEARGVLGWSETGGWVLPMPFTLPEGVAIIDQQGRDAGLRFVDIDEDGRLDLVFSNAQRYSLYLFTSMKDGWSQKILDSRRGETPAKDEIPPFVRADGTNNGAWFGMRHLWVQNEQTGGKLPGHVFGRSFTQLLGRDR